MPLALWLHLLAHPLLPSPVLVLHRVAAEGWLWLGAVVQ